MATPKRLEAVGIGTTNAQATVERGTQTIQSVVSKAGESGIHDLQVSLNEVDFLIKAAQLAACTIVHLDPTEQRLHKARLRGVHRLVELRKASEPVMQSGEVCQLLGVSRETVRKKVDRRQLLALPKGGVRVFPAFQFKDGAVLNGFAKALEALETESVFSVLAFFLSPNEDFENKTAIQMLESGEVETVLSEARTYLKHGS
jgi:hypothetical protein